MLYTGQRPEEVAALVWADLHLTEVRPHVLLRESTTKDKDKRAVPLHPVLASILRVSRPEGAKDSDLVLPRFPSRRVLLNDLKRSGIEKKDGLGRTLHLRSFRKTWQTLGVRYGINQRAAQEVLGHSDPKLTANVYTDVPSLSLHDEIAKLPWIGHSQLHSQIEAKKCRFKEIREVAGKLAELVNFAEEIALLEGKPGDSLGATGTENWSGRRDSNSRPPGPKPGALPG